MLLQWIECDIKRRTDKRRMWWTTKWGMWVCASPVGGGHLLFDHHPLVNSLLFLLVNPRAVACDPFSIRVPVPVTVSYVLHWLTQGTPTLEILVFATKCTSQWIIDFISQQWKILQNAVLHDPPTSQPTSDLHCRPYFIRFLNIHF